MLEDAAIKLSAVAASLSSVSARAMLGALIAGERDPAVLADLAKTRMRRKIPALTEALTGHFDEHHAVDQGKTGHHGHRRWLRSSQFRRIQRWPPSWKSRHDSPAARRRRGAKRQAQAARYKSRTSSTAYASRDRLAVGPRLHGRCPCMFDLSTGRFACRPRRGGQMLKQLRLVRYKGFEDYRVNFPDHTILVGPNNAGKSTVVGAVRLCSYLIGVAKRTKPNVGLHDETRDRHVVAYPVHLPPDRFVSENVRHEFRELETRLELTVKNGTVLYVVWPVATEPFFYFEQMPGANPTPRIAIRVARAWLPTIGNSPTLTPLAQSERVLSRAHVESNFGTRLASSHFRNQLLFYQEYKPALYEELVVFLLEHTPEITALRLDADKDAVDLYFEEPGRRAPKELVWAGDGLHIWLQLLFHMWRHHEKQVLLLDEPDVFLHPDLQRRLVRVLEGLEIPQTILASHSAEVVAEAERGAVVMIDRLRKRSVRPQTDVGLGDLGEAIGSVFNLRLTRAFRSKVVLFVEGQDMKMLSHLAKRVGAHKFASEQGLTVIPLGSFSQWRNAAAFGLLSKNFLGDAVKVRVLLDRDYRSRTQVAHVINSLETTPSVSAHVWGRKEIESYLLDDSLLLRVANVTQQQLDEARGIVLAALEADVQANYIAERLSEMKSTGLHQSTILKAATKDFKATWSDSVDRLTILPPKDYLTGLNRELKVEGARSLSSSKLAAQAREDELPAEIRAYLHAVEDDLA
ncbi:ATP-dependent nuclease [Geodermatophilus sp. SYSU D00758]